MSVDAALTEHYYGLCSTPFLFSIRDRFTLPLTFPLTFSLTFPLTFPLTFLLTFLHADVSPTFALCTQNVASSKKNETALSGAYFRSQKEFLSLQQELANQQKSLEAEEESAHAEELILNSQLDKLSALMKETGEIEKEMKDLEERVEMKRVETEKEQFLVAARQIKMLGELQKIFPIQRVSFFRDEFFPSSFPH